MENKHGLQTIVLTVFFLMALWIVLVPMALAQTPFYEGKNLLLLSGTDAGGAGDLRTRAVIPVLKKHIPGHPAIVVQYMPGAGGRKAANHMYKSVRPDGLTVGAMITGMVQGTIFGEKDVLYDLDKFIYLGSHARYAPYAFVTRKAAGFNSLETLIAARGVRIGAPSVASIDIAPQTSPSTMIGTPAAAVMPASRAASAIVPGSSPQLSMRTGRRVFRTCEVIVGPSSGQRVPG